MNTTRPRHPRKEIEDAIQEAEANGWIYRKSGKSSHAWGILLCPGSSSSCCKPFSIYGTPTSSENAANYIRKRIREHNRKVAYDQTSN